LKLDKLPSTAANDKNISDISNKEIEKVTDKSHRNKKKNKETLTERIESEEERAIVNEFEEQLQLKLAKIAHDQELIAQNRRIIEQQRESIHNTEESAEKLRQLIETNKAILHTNEERYHEAQVKVLTEIQEYSNGLQKLIDHQTRESIPDPKEELGKLEELHDDQTKDPLSRAKDELEKAEDTLGKTNKKLGGVGFREKKALEKKGLEIGSTE